MIYRPHKLMQKGKVVGINKQIVNHILRKVHKGQKISRLGISKVYNIYRPPILIPKDKVGINKKIVNHI